MVPNKTLDSSFWHTVFSKFQDRKKDWIFKDSYFRQIYKILWMGNKLSIKSYGQNVYCKPVLTEIALWTNDLDTIKCTNFNIVLEQGTIHLEI